jgi:hypothetical protein
MENWESDSQYCGCCLARIVMFEVDVSKNIKSFFDILGDILTVESVDSISETEIVLDKPTKIFE